jgi:hypothetical protein
LFKSFCHGCGGRVIDFNVCRLEHDERFRTAVSGDNRLNAKTGYGLRGLNASALRRIKVLLIIDDLEGFGLHIIDEKFRRSSKTAVERRVEIIS